MKKYANVLVALCALFAFGLVSCKSYSDDDNNAALVAVLNQQNNVSKTSADYANDLKASTGIQLDKKYETTGAYAEYFIVSSDGTVEYGYVSGTEPGLKGKIIATELPPAEYKGIIIYLKNEKHVNYGCYCYPDYDEDKWEGSKVDSSNYGAITHHGCYTAIYITNGDTDTTFKMAQAVWKPANQPNGYTTCAKSLEKAKELFAICDYDATCEGGSSTFTRSLSSEKIPGFICGTFTLSDAE